jgi:outer membrane biosynthesis protein TonB
MLNIRGDVVLAISVDPSGKVACVKIISGPPLMFGVTIDSVKQWKFQPVHSKRAKKNVCGQVAVRLQANEHGVKYKIK